MRARANRTSFQVYEVRLWLLLAQVMFRPTSWNQSQVSPKPLFDPASFPTVRSVLHMSQRKEEEVGKKEKRALRFQGWNRWWRLKMRWRRYSSRHVLETTLIMLYSIYGIVQSGDIIIDRINEWSIWYNDFILFWIIIMKLVIVLSFENFVFSCDML